MTADQTLTASLAHILGVGDDDAPADEQDWRSWLAERGLGLVRVVDPERFEWAGPFLGRAEAGWAVMFGVPPGVLFDPSRGAWEGPPTEAMVVAPLSPTLSGLPQAGPASGRVEQIVIAPAAEARPVSVDSAVAVPGRGLDGDRYSRGQGTFSGGAPAGRALTLVEAEVLEQVGLAGADARRNLVTRRIELNALVGRPFFVGDVECRGRRLCEPCAHLQRLTRPGVLPALVHRGGLRADILTGGEIAVGADVRVD